MATSREEFIEYARAAAPRLRRTAYLLCHDWDLAQDLTQITLTKTYLSWAKIVSRDNPDVFARKVLLRSFLDHQRRLSSQETVTSYLPEATAPPEPHTLRITLMDALQHITPRNRAIVVLRYWEDRSIDDTAAVLRLSSTAVRSRSMRALAKVRELLGADFVEFVEN